MKINKYLVIIIMTVMGMTVSSCDQLENPVPNAEVLSISSENHEFLNKDGQIEMEVGKSVHLLLIMDYYWTPTKDIFLWTSSYPSVAVIDENGVLKAVGLGTTVITATWADDPSYQASIEVVVKEEAPEDNPDDDIEDIVTIGDDEVSQGDAQAPGL